MVARLNIKNYHKLLAGEMEDTKRQTILRLLAEEEFKLASMLEACPKEKNNPAKTCQ